MALSAQVAAGPQSDDLGALVFKRWQDSSFRLCVAFVLLFGGIGIFALIQGLTTRDSGGFVAACLFLGIAALVLAIVVVRARKVLRCHENGVWVSTWLRERGLRFDQTASFTYSATKLYVEGIPIGTSFKLQFVPDPESGAKPISFSGRLRKRDAQIEGLIDTVSQAVARRLARVFVSGAPVAWTRNLTLRAEGIEYRPAGFVKRKPPEILPYEAIADMKVQEAVFSLWRWGQKRPLLREPTTQPNFFPGLRLLTTILEKKRAAST